MPHPRNSIPSYLPPNQTGRARRELLTKSVYPELNRYLAEDSIAVARNLHAPTDDAVPERRCLAATLIGYFRVGRVVGILVSVAAVLPHRLVGHDHGFSDDISPT